MCAERMQRILIACVLGIIMGLFATATAGTMQMQIAVLAQTFIIIMMLVWAFTNFCPSLWFFKKVFPPCPWENR